jgi:hypothetical protein
MMATEVLPSASFASPGLRVITAPVCEGSTGDQAGGRDKDMIMVLQMRKLYIVAHGDSHITRNGLRKKITENECYKR